jgi:hypothetical protein
MPNIEWASERDITTAQPKGILLIGRLSPIQNDREQLESLERFRRHLWNPEVLTFDELYERAMFILERTRTDEPSIVVPPPETIDEEWADYPF